MRQYIGAVRAKNNILSPHCLFGEIMPINKAVASRNGNRFLTQKLHVQILYNLRSPQCQTIELINCFLPNPPHFSLPSTFKGTVRPDWICMRVVSLESPLKGHQPLYVFNFLFFDLEYLIRVQSSEPLHPKMNPTSCLFGSRFT
jgi:hypothetical protein